MSSIVVSTPCRRICVLDAERTHCLGCGRTVAQIAAWSRMSEAERRAVIAQLAEHGRRDPGTESGGTEGDAS